MLEAILFDVDGTLADTEKDGHRVAFNMAFAEAGLTWQWDEVLYGKLLAVTGGKERMTHYVKTYHPELWQEEMSSQIAQLQLRKTFFYTSLLSQGKIPLRTGVARLIQEIKAAGVRMAIVTTTTPENVTALLTHTLGEDSIAWFELIAAGDIVPKKKPASDIYDYALAKMNLAPENCIALEDSYNGIQAASSAKIPTIITVNEYTQEDDFTGALLVLSDLGEPSKQMRCLQGNYEKPYIDLAGLQGLMTK
jgi:HAD superfamily hydrolase (TIGR01509 family)